MTKASFKIMLIINQFTSDSKYIYILSTRWCCVPISKQAATFFTCQVFADELGLYGGKEGFLGLFQEWLGWWASKRF